MVQRLSINARSECTRMHVFDGQLGLVITVLTKMLVAVVDEDPMVKTEVVVWVLLEKNNVE